MRRGKPAALAACAIAIAAVVTVTLLPSSSAASVTRYSPGYLLVEAGKVLTINVFNPTDKPVVFTASVQGPTGFTGTPTNTDTVQPGGTIDSGFTCGATSCTGVVLVTSSSKRLIPTARLLEPSELTDEITHAYAGDWKVFK